MLRLPNHILNKQYVHEDRRNRCAAARWSGVACVMVLLGCVGSRESVASIELDQPRANRGLLTSDIREDGLKRIADAEIEAGIRLAQTSEPAPSPSPPPDPVPPAESVSSVQPEIGNRANRARLVELPKLSGTEIRELIDSLRLQLEASSGFRSNRDADAGPPMDLPAGVTDAGSLVRDTENGREWLRFGFKRFLSQPPRLWVHGVVESNGSPAQPSPVLDTIASEVKALIKNAEGTRTNLSNDDLEARLIQLSYIDTLGATAALQGLGITTMKDLAQIPDPIKFEQLPVVAPMPSPTHEQIGLIGDSKAATGAFDVSITPSIATALPTDANMAPSSQLLVYFHPAHPEQYSRVRRLLTDMIDRPARQIFVEGMVLEISEEGLSELGVEWQFQEGNFDWVVGALTTGGTVNTLTGTFDDSANLTKNWIARLRALVDEGTAEILSRPSVLTLDNRQATIRVGTDIPIATSSEGTGSNANKISFNFRYLATGIALNVRPRVNESGEEVSMLIDTIVSAVVPGADLELRANSGEVLASAPTVSTRRIQTYSRIANNTPFIIGGLVGKEQTVTRRKVPLLGDIPYLGVLFRSQKTESRKREVIIVLTPHVLAENRSMDPGRYLPKDEDRFDEFGNTLYYDTYRIRAEDVFDLDFLLENRGLRRMQELAEEAVNRNFKLAWTDPFMYFVNGRIPGERILVHRMLYEVVKRLSNAAGNPEDWLDERVAPNKLIIFDEQQRSGGYSVRFLADTVAQLARGKTAEDFFKLNPGKALAIVFHHGRNARETDRIHSEPVPELMIMDCPDSASWGRLLWDLNQPDEQGPRNAILIHDPEDLIRLKRAVWLKRIIDLNGGDNQMSLDKFSLGKVVLMPDPNPDQTHLISAETARYFFHTEHYYAAAIQLIESKVDALKSALQFAPTDPATTPPPGSR